jgi:hypothetical protein
LLASQRFPGDLEKLWLANELQSYIDSHFQLYGE